MQSIDINRKHSDRAERHVQSLDLTKIEEKQKLQLNRPPEMPDLKNIQRKSTPDIKPPLNDNIQQKLTATPQFVNESPLVEAKLPLLSSNMQPDE